MKRWQKIFIAIYAIASIVALLLATARASVEDGRHATQRPEPRKAINFRW